MTTSTSRIASLVRLAVVAGGACAALSGCYVVPMQPLGQPLPPPQALAVMPAAPLAQTFMARLYPSNAEAAAFGMIGATVTNEMDGRGRFSTVIGGEQFTGEAKRLPGAQRGGVANASGSRGGMLSCRYAMNSPTLG
ncbi:MAG: hypothetical protein EOO24_63990, partial [Comamonadaceae bacterium]